MIEDMLRYICKAYYHFNVVILRNFNKSGLIGENPNDIPNNLMLYVS